MKFIYILLISLPLIGKSPLVIKGVNWEQSVTGKNQESVKGAENHDELSKMIFSAIKENNFNDLKKVIPGESEIAYLKETSTERNKPFFENLNEEIVQSRIVHDFDEIIQEGISQEINWSTIELIDYKTRSCAIENIGCTVTLQTEDAKGNQYLYSYDAIQVKDRWFIFQNLMTEEKSNKFSQK